MKYIIMSFIITIFSGCVTTKIPAKSEYRINTNVQNIQTQVNGCKDKSLKVAQAFSSSTLMSNSMMYAKGDLKQYAYAESLWAQSPNSVITSKFLRLIRETNLFKSVQISKSRSRNDFMLEINIEDFMQYFDVNATRSHVNVSVNLTLIDVKSNKVFASHSFDAKVDAKSLDAQGGVEALNIALNKVLSDASIWISGACK